MRRVQGFPDKDLWPSELIEDDRMMLKRVYDRCYGGNEAWMEVSLVEESI